MPSAGSNFNEQQDTLSVYNTQLRNLGSENCIVCPTNPIPQLVGQVPYLPNRFRRPIESAEKGKMTQ